MMVTGRSQAPTAQHDALRVVSINQDLYADRSSEVQLFYQYENALHKASAGAGIEYVVIGGADAKPPPDFPVPLVATLVDNYPPLGPASWPASWRGRQPRELCDSVLSALDRIPARDPANTLTAIFLYHGHPALIAGLIRLGLALGGTSPIVLNLYHLHAVYGLNRPTRVPGLRKLLATTRELRCAANLHLRVDSARLADFIRRDTGEDIPVLPFFSPSGVEPADGARRQPAGAPIRIVYPTARPGRDKGFDLVIALAEKLGRRDIEIVAREPLGNIDEVCLPTKAALAGGLQILPAFLPGASYGDLLAESDLVLIPYARWQFLSRTSGIVADAIRLGKPMVGTADCWIGDQIEALGAGKTFRDGDAGDFTEAVRDTLDQLESIRRNLLDRRPNWIQDNNLVAFLRAILDCGRVADRPYGKLRRRWYLARLKTVTHGLLPWRSLAAEPIGYAVHRARQWLYGKSGMLAVFVNNRFTSWMRSHPAIIWRTRGVAHVELRLGAPDGFHIADGEGRGAVWMSVWIPDGSWLYLQDVSGGKPLIAEHTLSRVRLRTLLRRPADSPAGRNRARQLLAWRSLIRLIRRLFWLRQGDLHLEVPPLRRDVGALGMLSWDCTPGEGVEILAHGQRLSRKASRGTLDTGTWVEVGTWIILLDARKGVLPKPFRLLDAIQVSATPDRPARAMVGRVTQAIVGTIRGRRPPRVPRQTVVRPSEEALAGAVPPSPSVAKILAAVQPNEWGIVPPPTSGEIYLLCAYARTFLDIYGGDRLVIFAPRGHLDILRLFPDAPVGGLDRADFPLGELGLRTRIGRVMDLSYGFAGPGPDDTVGRHSHVRSGFAQLFLREIGISLDMKATHPRLMPDVRAAAVARMRELGLPEGRTVFLAPTSTSQQPLPRQSWQRIADMLRQRGFTVATNCGPGESALPGTLSWTGPISELFAAAEIGGFFISMRNGLCEVCCTANTAFHILWDDRIFAPWAGITMLGKLADNGFPDRAVYHTMLLDERPRAFADRVLAHPNFQAASRAR